MTKNQNSKQDDLEERTLKFAKQVRVFVKKLKRTIANIEDGRQLITDTRSYRAYEYIWGYSSEERIGF